MSQRFTSNELRVNAPLYSENRRVRFQDVDAASIIFFPRILEYYSDVYVSMLRSCGVDLVEVIDTAQWNAPIVHAESDYISAVRFGAELRVMVVAIQLGRSSYAVGYRIERMDASIVTVGHTVHVCIDAKTFTSIPIPMPLRSVLESL